MTQPVSEIDVRIEVPSRDYWPRKISDAGAINMEFVDLSDHFDREVVDAVLADEARLLGSWFDGRATLEEFDALCEEQDTPEDFLLSGIAEPGTAGAVATLNLVGCPTFWSCNGEHGDYVPNICFWARAAMVPKLVVAAQSAGVGLVPNDGGIEVYATSRKGLHDFAVGLLAAVPESDRR